MFDPPRVAVVGAGPAGLAAAQLLTSRGLSVKVYEKLPTPGGRSGCDLVDGIRFDRGAEFVTSFYPRTLRMIRNHGLAAHLMPVRLEGDILFDGQRFPLPLQPWALFTSPLLSWRTKAALFSFAPQLLSWRLRYRWTEMEKAATFDVRSALEFFRERIGEDYVRVILGPTLESFILSPAAETSHVVAMIQAHESLGARFYCIRGGMATLWETIAKQLPVSYQVAVERIVPDAAGVRIELPEGIERADAAIIAIPGPEAIALLPEHHPERSIAAQSRYSAVVKLHASLDRRQHGIRPVCLGELGHASLAGVGNLEAKGSGQTTGGRGSLHAWTGPILGRELIESDEVSIRRRMLSEAEKLLGVELPRIRETSIVRLRCGLPIFYTGWLRQLAEWHQNVKPNAITLAGDYLASPSMEGAIRTGEEAAQRTLRFLHR